MTYTPDQIQKAVEAQREKFFLETAINPATYLLSPIALSFLFASVERLERDREYFLAAGGELSKDLHVRIDELEKENADLRILNQRDSRPDTSNEYPKPHEA